MQCIVAPAEKSQTQHKWQLVSTHIVIPIKWPQIWHKWQPVLACNVAPTKWPDAQHKCGWPQLALWCPPKGPKLGTSGSQPRFTAQTLSRDSKLSTSSNTPERADFPGRRAPLRGALLPGELLRRTTGLVMGVVFLHNHRSQQVRNPSMSYISDYKLCQLDLNWFHQDDKGNERYREKQSEKASDSIQISLA